MNRFSYQITVVIFITTISIAAIVAYLGLQSSFASAQAEAEEKLLSSSQIAARRCEGYFKAQESSALAIKNMVESTYDLNQAVQEIHAHSGSQFDPQLARIFLENEAAFRIAYGLREELLPRRGDNIEDFLSRIYALSGLTAELSPAG